MTEIERVQFCVIQRLHSMILQDCDREKVKDRRARHFCFSFLQTQEKEIYSLSDKDERKNHSSIFFLLREREKKKEII
jgi:hypothetical protein